MECGVEGRTDFLFSFEIQLSKSHTFLLKRTELYTAFLYKF